MVPELSCERVSTPCSVPLSGNFVSHCCLVTHLIELHESLAKAVDLIAVDYVAPTSVAVSQDAEERWMPWYWSLARALHVAVFPSLQNLEGYIQFEPSTRLSITELGALPMSVMKRWMSLTKGLRAAGWRTAGRTAERIGRGKGGEAYSICSTVISGESSGGCKRKVGAGGRSGAEDEA